MQFKLLAGQHEVGLTRYEVGSVIETDTDLAAMFGADKFQRLDGPQAQALTPAQPPDLPPQPTDPTNTLPIAATPAVATLGRDVTDEFPTAAELDLIVYRNGQNRRYYVAAKANPQTALHPHPLARAAVEPFIAEQAAK